jgi:hypothetical protein
MAAGAPILISDRVGCASDLVPDSENGLQFNPFNEENIASTLLHFSSSSIEQKQKYGKRSKELISNWGPGRFATGLKKAVDKATKTGVRNSSFIASLLLRLLLQRGML